MNCSVQTEVNKVFLYLTPVVASSFLPHFPLGYATVEPVRIPILTVTDYRARFSLKLGCIRRLRHLGSTFGTWAEGLGKKLKQTRSILSFVPSPCAETAEQGLPKCRSTLIQPRLKDTSYRIKGCFTWKRPSSEKRARIYHLVE